MAAAIEVNSLTKRFGSLLAVNRVSFSVAKGEIFGYLGPNGAGKTTTIRILTGITPPSSGHAHIFGYDIQQEKLTARRLMGIVPETSNVYDDLSAWKNLMFSAELYHVRRSEREARASELLRTFDLYERRHDMVRGFSKGMKRRLTIAMGLVHNPPLIFLDEPTSGLDVQSNLIIRKVIRELNREGVTVFLTTHNIEEANQICDRVAIINRGIIAAIDTPERLKKTIQSVQAVEIVVEDRSRILEALSRVKGVDEIRVEGERIRLYTPNPGMVIEETILKMKEMGILPVSVNTLGPTLEDVFIRLTGLERTVE